MFLYYIPRNIMKLHTLLVIAKLIMVATLFAPAAHAATTSSASLTGFTYQLIDLDLNDGIAASLTFSSVSPWVAVAGYQDNSGSPSPVEIIDYAGTVSFAAPFGSAQAQLNNQGSYVTQTTSANRISADVIVRSNFILSPNTTVIFSGYGSVDTQAGAIPNHGNAAIFAYDLSDTSAYPDYYQDYILLNSEPSVAHQLSLSFTSLNAGLTGVVGTAVSAGSEIATAVPEADTYGMLLAGLATLGIVTRRRKQAAT
jgi:hypothetical protein